MTAFLAALLVAVPAIWLWRRSARGLGLVDHPGQHKGHARAVASAGGLAVYAAVLAGVWSHGPPDPALARLLQAGGLLAVIGLLDDLRSVDARLKLACLAAASAIAFPGHWLVAFLWLGLVTSAFNGLDNADGSASGVAVIAGLGGAALGGERAALGLALAGACAGFLRFNYPPASVFLGDCGSLSLGFLLASLTMPTEIDLRQGLLLLGVPLFDFALVLLVRVPHYRRWYHPITMCARDHVFHRLRALGWSHRACLAALYGSGLMLGGAALCLPRLEPYRAGALTALVLGLALMLGIWLGQVDMKDAYDSDRISR